MKNDYNDVDAPTDYNGVNPTDYNGVSPTDYNGVNPTGYNDVDAPTDYNGVSPAEPLYTLFYELLYIRGGCGGYEFTLQHLKGIHQGQNLIFLYNVQSTVKGGGLPNSLKAWDPVGLM